MYFLYADGSGQTLIKHNRHDNGLYILSGVIVHEQDWKVIEEDLTRLKRQTFPDLDPKSWELHAYDIWYNRGFFADETLNLNFAKKQEIFANVLDLICNSRLTLLDVVIFKDRMNRIYNAPQPMRYSWTFLVERFEHFLRQRPKNTNNGLIFMDSSEKTSESEIKNIVMDVVRNENSQQRVEHVIEDIIFTKSHLRNMIQLADIVAYITHKHYRHDLKFKVWFEKMTSKMYAHNDKLRGFGIKEFPKYRKAGPHRCRALLSCNHTYAVITTIL